MILIDGDTESAVTLTLILTLTDGDTESAVEARHIKAQEFAMGDLVEVNCAGKGVWYQAEVSEVYPTVGKYKVKYKSDSIKWVTNKAVKGTEGKNR